MTKLHLPGAVCWLISISLFLWVDLDAVYQSGYTSAPLIFPVAFGTHGIIGFLMLEWLLGQCWKAMRRTPK